jgi:exosortase A-associated hydrolase 1
MSAPGATTPVLFSCQGSQLVGILHLPDTLPSEVAILVIVGGPQYRVGSHRQFVLTARALAGAGHAVLRFDYRGMGDSEGEYKGFEHVAEDIRAAIDALTTQCQPLRGVVLLGLCDAASAALMYCCTDRRVAGLVLMNPWVRSEQLQAAVMVRRYYARRLLQPAFWRKLASGGFDFLGSAGSLWANLLLATRRKPVARTKGFIESMCFGLNQFAGPVLIVQSGRDLTADEFRARSRSSADWQRGLARKSVEVIDLDGADHTFSRMSDLEEFNRHCREWLSRQFGVASCR